VLEARRGLEFVVVIRGNRSISLGFADSKYVLDFGDLLIKTDGISTNSPDDNREMETFRDSQPPT
jgi:hypothetical protein